MKELYKKDSVSNHRIGLLAIFCSFPYLSKEKIIEYIDDLNTRKHPAEEFVAYFNEFWMGNRFDSWNVSSKGKWERERATNNGIESFNARLKAYFSSAHPRIDKLLSALMSISNEKQRLIEAGIERCETHIDMPVVEEIEYRFEEYIKQFPLKPEFQESLAAEQSMVRQ